MSLQQGEKEEAVWKNSCSGNNEEVQGMRITMRLWGGKGKFRLIFFNFLSKNN